MHVYCRAKHKLNKGFDYTELREQDGDWLFCPAPDMPGYVNRMFDLAIGIKIYCALFADSEARLNLSVFGVGFSGSDIAWCSGDDVWLLNLLFVAQNRSEVASLLNMMDAYMTDFEGMGNKLISCFSRTAGDVEYTLDTSAYNALWREQTERPAIADIGEIAPDTMYCLFTPEKLSASDLAQLPEAIFDRYGLKCKKDDVHLSLDGQRAGVMIQNAFADNKAIPFIKLINRLFNSKKK